MLCAWLFGCVTSVPLPGAPKQPGQTAPIVEEDDSSGAREMLLLLEDRRIYEPVTVDRSLVEGAAVRARLALALGRIGGADAELVLDELLIDPELEVRRAAALSLAILSSGSVGAVRPISSVPVTGALVSALGSDDVVTARWAAQALALRAISLDEVSEALVLLIGEDGAEAELWSRLLPALPLFDQGARQAAARVYLEGHAESKSADPPEWRSLRRSAVRALVLDFEAVDADRFRQLCGDPDPWIRAWSCKALGFVGEREDLKRLHEVATQAAGLDDLLARSAVLSATIEAAAQLVLRGVVAPSDEWRSVLLAQLSSPLAGARMAAQRAASAWLLDEGLAGVLRSQVGQDDGEALLALAGGRDPGAAELVATAARSTDSRLVAAAARAAAILGMEAVLETLLGDERPLVRWGALEGVADVDPERAAEALTLALGDSSASVRASALRWLADRPVLGLEEIVRSFEDLPADALELRLQGLLAIEALADENRLERGGAIVALEEMAGSSVYPVRASAAATLARLGRPVPVIGGPEVRRTADYYGEIDRRSRGERYLQMMTTQGDLTFRVPCEQAPLTCVSFIQLAEQGFYDGLAFARLVPGGQLVGGDPFGDGFGGPGYRLRDEPTALELDRPGMLVLERSGPDAGGSRFFLTLGPLPELARHEVVLGEIVSDLDILARLGEEDRILALREVAPPARSARRDPDGETPQTPRGRGSAGISP